MSFSTVHEFDEAYSVVRKTFATGKTKDKKWRRLQIQKTWWMLEDNKDKIAEALQKDLNKHRQESLTNDVAQVQASCLHMLKNLDKWTADERPAKSDPLNFLGKTTVRKEPKGAALIIGCWNFPFLLLIEPMISAIAAGCTMIIKPSDMAKATQDLIAEIVPKYLDSDAIRCITAGPNEMAYILENRFDHIFYTGSSKVAKIIHAAAAKTLTPVTLELGGQGPAIVCKTADIDLSAKRIACTKFMNAGQVCLNVNHVLIDATVKQQFVDALIKYFDQFLGSRENRPSYYAHIINERNFDRLSGLLEQTTGQIVYGGVRDRENLYFGPTIVTGVRPGDSLMSEELFGPILPIIEADLEESICLINSMEHSLALYGFTSSKAEKDRILRETQSGGVTFNDCLLHMTAKDAPFGGVGNSGIGAYHGAYGVMEFSHLRTFIDPPTWIDRLMAHRYPPYTNEKASAMVRMLAPVSKPYFDREGRDTRLFRGWFRWVISACLVALVVNLGWWGGLTLLRLNRLLSRRRE